MQPAPLSLLTRAGVALPRPLPLVYLVRAVPCLPPSRPLPGLVDYVPQGTAHPAPIRRVRRPLGGE